MKEGYLDFFQDFEIDKETPIPLYFQLKNIIIECIANLPDGSVIPTTQEIMRHFQISDTTVRLAMKELVKEKVVARKTGVGTIVRKETSPLTERYNTISSMPLYAPIDFDKLHYPGFKGESITIGISANETSTPFFRTLHNVLREKLGQSAVNTVFFDAEGSLGNQKKHLKRLMDKKVDLLIVNPCTPSSEFNDLMMKLNTAGIPVLSMDSKLDGSCPFLSHIGCDNYQLGVRIGRYAAGYFKRTKKKDHLRIAVIEGPQENVAGIQREDGFLKGLGELYVDEQVDIAFRHFGDWSRASGYTGIEEHLEECGNLDLIYTYSDNMALGAIRAIKDKGLPPIQFAGIDGSKDALEVMIHHGPILAIGINNPSYIGSLTAGMAVKFLATGSLPSKNILTEPVIITNENAHSFYDEQSRF